MRAGHLGRIRAMKQQQRQQQQQHSDGAGAEVPVKEMCSKGNCGWINALRYGLVG